MKTKTLRLYADDLLSKNGFGDGDLLEYYADELEEAGIDYSVVINNELLQRLVERHLAPLLPNGSEVYRMDSIHNPIRIAYDDDDYEVMEALLSDISVDVSFDQILAVAMEIQNECC